MIAANEYSKENVPYEFNLKYDTPIIPQRQIHLTKDVKILKVEFEEIGNEHGFTSK